MNQTQQLAYLLQSETPLLIPGVYDGITAQLVRKAGFPAAYVTGAGLSLSILGQPDINTVSYGELLARVWQISSVFQGPLLVDIDTGFGGSLNIARVIQDFTRLNVAAVQIEDQLSPKRCGHLEGKKVVPLSEMRSRIAAVLNSRIDGSPLLIARTDARGPEGLEEALRRAECFAEWGANLIFVEGLRSLAEIEALCARIHGPLLYNNAEGGASPYLSRKELREYGFAAAIYPNSLARAMSFAGMDLLRHLKEEGSTLALLDRLYTHRELFALFDQDGWLDLADALTADHFSAK